MKLIIMIIAVLCVTGVTARAEMQQDVINRDAVGSAVNDYGLFLLPVNNGDGYQVNSPDGTKNATWKHDGTDAVFDTSSGSFSFADPVRLSGESSLPACTSAEAGQMSYYKPSTAPGFMVSCIDNGGLYELVPMGQQTAGFQWNVEEFSLKANGIYDIASGWWYLNSDANHQGIVWINSDGTGADAGYLGVLISTGSTNANVLPAGADNLTVEWIVRTDDANLTSVRYLVGITSEYNVAAPSGDSALFRFDTSNSDTTWQAVNSNAGTETVTDTGVAVNTNTWYRLIVVITASEIKFYVGISGGDVSLVATHSINLPASDTMTPYAEVRESSASGRDLYLDYLRWSSLGLDR